MRSAVLLVAVTASISGCVEAPGVSETTQAVQAGDRTSLFPAVGFLENKTSESGCGATLIGERTLLTAAHCLNRARTDTRINLVRASDIRFYVLDDATNLGGRRNYTAEKLIPHPEFGGGAKNDIAVVILRDAPSGAVERLALATLPPVIGEEVTILGHGGVRSTDSSFIKRAAVNTIANVYDWVHTFEGDGNICDGDSGSASVAHRNGQDVMLGVHTGRKGDCGETGYDMRVDAYHDWIVEVTGGDIAAVEEAPEGDEDDEDDKADGPGTGISDDEAAAGCSVGGAARGWLPLLIALAGIAARRSRRLR